MDGEIRQIIVVRTDLRNIHGQKVRTGKIAVQVAHAAMGFLLNKSVADSVIEEWLADGQTKICVVAESEAELVDITTKAEDAGLPVHMITDLGRTEFGKPTKTCTAIGPAKVSQLHPITGHLKLL